MWVAIMAMPAHLSICFRIPFTDERLDFLGHVTDAKFWKVPHHLRHGIHSTQELVCQKGIDPKFQPPSPYLVTYLSRTQTNRRLLIAVPQ